MKLENIDEGLTVWSVIIGLLIVAIPDGPAVLPMIALGFLVLLYLGYRLITGKYGSERK